MMDTSNDNNDIANNQAFVWTVPTIAQALALFIVAGLAEIGGGWLVWQAVRGSSDNKDTQSSDRRHEPKWWWAILGSVILIVYGFLPTLQPTDSFGRVYAVYGGFFIVLSFLIGWWLDGDRPDRGDYIGGCVSIGGVLIILFWPRSG